MNAALAAAASGARLTAFIEAEKEAGVRAASMSPHLRSESGCSGGTACVRGRRGEGGGGGEYERAMERAALASAHSTAARAAVEEARSEDGSHRQTPPSSPPRMPLSPPLLPPLMWPPTLMSATIMWSTTDIIIEGERSRRTRMMWKLL